MTKWEIDAPVWETSGSYVHAGIRLGSAWKREDYPGFLATVYCGRPLTIECKTDADARAWVEAKVMEDMGATVHDPDAEWNVAIEAAAALPLAAGDSRRIRALKRGGGDA